MSEDAKRQEDREFQLQMLDVQTSIGTGLTYFSLVVTIAYSVSLSLYTIAVTNIPEYLRIILLYTSFISLLVGIASNLMFGRFNRLTPRKIQKIREQFVNPLAHEKTKKSVMVTLDQDLLKWLGDEIDNKEFGSISHGIEKALTLMKQQYEEKK